MVPRRVVTLKEGRYINATGCYLVFNEGEPDVTYLIDDTFCKGVRTVVGASHDNAGITAVAPNETTRDVVRKIVHDGILPEEEIGVCYVVAESVARANSSRKDLLFTTLDGMQHPLFAFHDNPQLVFE